MKTYEEAQRLAKLMEKVGTASGKRCRAIVTDMNMPLGSSIGNALEVKEAVEILQNRKKGVLYDLCIELTANMLELAGKGSLVECRVLAENAVTSGRALEVLRKTIQLQGGDPRVADDVSLLPQAKYSYVVKAACDMKITAVNSEEIGMTSVLLGAGRTEKGAEIDMSAGIVMECSCGDCLNEGDAVMTLYSSVCSDFSEAAIRALNAVTFEEI